MRIENKTINCSTLRFILTSVSYNQMELVDLLIRYLIIAPYISNTQLVHGHVCLPAPYRSETMKCLFKIISHTINLILIYLLVRPVNKILSPTKKITLSRDLLYNVHSKT